MQIHCKNYLDTRYFLDTFTKQVLSNSFYVKYNRYIICSSSFVIVTSCSHSVHVYLLSKNLFAFSSSNFSNVKSLRQFRRENEL